MCHIPAMVQLFYDNMNSKKYHTFRIALQSNRKIIETEFEFEFWCLTPLSAIFQLYNRNIDNIDTTSTHIHDHSLSLHTYT